MTLAITLRPSTPASDPDLPTWPLGQDIDLTAGFLNASSEELTIDDPRTSQKLLLSFHSHPQGEHTLLELNPPSVDVTGEITAPPSKQITLRAGESVERQLSLVKLCGDRCLVPGRFEARVEYADATSPVFHFGIEYTAASVPCLLEIALDERSGPWSRRQALALLRELPAPPALEPSPGMAEDPTAAATRRALNQQRAAHYLQAFPELASRPDFAAVFERRRLPR